jgi:hypothetical protein
MHAIRMPLYAVSAILFAAAFAHALVCWVIDRPRLSAHNVKPRAAANPRRPSSMRTKQ